MGTLITDPNAPPDPTQVAPIPDAQHPAGQDINRHNPITPGVPPSADYPIGIAPEVAATRELPPWQADEKKPAGGGEPPGGGKPAAAPPARDEKHEATTRDEKHEDKYAATKKK